MAFHFKGCWGVGKKECSLCVCWPPSPGFSCDTWLGLAAGCWKAFIISNVVLCAWWFLLETMVSLPSSVSMQNSKWHGKHKPLHRALSQPPLWSPLPITVLWLWGIHKASALLKIVRSSCKCYYNSDIQILNLLCSVKNSCEQRHPFLILSWGVEYWMSQRLSPEAGAVWEKTWVFFTPVSSSLICWCCCWTQRTSEWERRKWIKRKWGVAKMKLRK